MVRYNVAFFGNFLNVRFFYLGYYMGKEKFCYLGVYCFFCILGNFSKEKIFLNFVYVRDRMMIYRYE